MTAKKWILLICSVTAILLGILMIIFPVVTLNIIVCIIASAMILAGLIYSVYYFVRKREAFTQFDLVIGLGIALIGLICLARLDEIVSALPVIIGICLAGISFYTLQNMINLIRIRNTGWVFLMILSIIAFSFGMFLCFGDASAFIMVLLGIALAFCGLAVLITSFILKDKFNVDPFKSKD